jgi:hypothetical protein
MPQNNTLSATELSRTVFSRGSQFAGRTIK